MGGKPLCVLFFVLVFLLISLGLTLASLVTDLWYKVDGSASSNVTVKNSFSYTFGMWRKCYEHELPADVDLSRRAGKCVYTYQDMIPADDRSLTFEQHRYLHLERSWVGCMIACAGIQIFAVLTLICGLWPADCRSFKRSSLYLLSSFLCLIAGMCGIASGIVFIALRDKDIKSRDIYPEDVSYTYYWSFGFGWGGTGLCILEGFLFLCLLKMDYNDINETKKYNPFD